MLKLRGKRKKMMKQYSHFCGLKSNFVGLQASKDLIFDVLEFFLCYTSRLSEVLKGGLGLHLLLKNNEKIEEHLRVLLHEYFKMILDTHANFNYLWFNISL